MVKKCLCGCGRKVAKEGNKWILGHNKRGKKLSKETKEKLSILNRGLKHPKFIHGKQFLYNQHLKHKKEECLFGCESKFYILHHEPPIQDILEWEGKLINLCRSCHKKVHDRTLKLPENVGIKWTLKDTERLFKK